MTNQNAAMRIVERSGNLVRLAGSDGWLHVRHLRPCAHCGGTRFRRQVKSWGWYCVNCHPLRRRLVEGPAIDVDEVRRQLDGG